MSARDFNWRHYVQLNPDLKLVLTTEEAATFHWLTQGSAQGRLHHPSQLTVTAEFGQELLLYTCYYYYLYTNGLLFNNKITTYKGMKPFYWFLPPEQVIYRSDQRRWLEPRQRPPLPNRDEHVRNFNYKLWKALPLRRVYKDCLSPVSDDKPLLIIQNKYNDEWDTHSAINFIPLTTLTTLTTLLSSTYQLVYIRPRGTEPGYSRDHNQELEGFRDYEVLPPTVLTMDKLMTQYSLSYNELKVALFAQCKHFIGVQGGSSHYAAFFGGKQLILHVRGREIESNAYNGWYKHLSTDLPLDLVVVRTSDELVDKARQLFVRPVVND